MMSWMDARALCRARSNGMGGMDQMCAMNVIQGQSRIGSLSTGQWGDGGSAERRGVDMICARMR